jgi:hypothetical protein
MKKYKYSILILLSLSCLPLQQLIAQDSSATEQPSKKVIKPIKGTFESNWVFDNQSVMVAKKGTFEMDIQHRFGVVKNGYSDLFGLYAPSNIRIGFSYVLRNKLQVGLGFCKERLQWDGNIKYSIIKQSISKGFPISVTYFGNVVVDTRTKENFVSSSDRFSYFNQLIIARKVTSKFSLQVAPSLSYFNNVPGYVNTKGEILPMMNNVHLAMAFAGRYKVTPKMSLMANYDQPLTTHASKNPHPNISFGLEMTTSAHAFQLFAGNYNGIIPQSNNMFNQNDPANGQFLIGFNITRLWSF